MWSPSDADDDDDDIVPDTTFETGQIVPVWQTLSAAVFISTCATQNRKQKLNIAGMKMFIYS